MGRPAKYTNVEELEQKINEYFAKCDENDEPYTVVELALSLGYAGRQGLWGLRLKKKFMDTIKKGLDRIEGERVRKMLKGSQNVAGCIFDLKNNFGYKDKVEQEISGPGGGPIAIAALPPSPDSIALWEQQIIESRRRLEAIEVKAKEIPEKT